MQDLLAFVVVMIAAVGGAELVRATCRRQLAAPVRNQVRPEPQRVSVLAD